MKKLINCAAIALLALTTVACTSANDMRGPNAAYNRGGKSAVTKSSLWNAKAHCTATGKRGYAYRQSTPADAASKAIAMCIRNGGIPACCRVDELTPVRRG